MQPRVLQKKNDRYIRHFAFDLLLNIVWPGHTVRALGESVPILDVNNNFDFKMTSEFNRHFRIFVDPFSEPFGIS